MRPRLVALALILAFASLPVFGQSAAPAPTQVKGHLMGESVADFFARSGYPGVLDQCRAVGGNKKQAKKLGLDLKTCEAYVGAERGLAIYATDPAWFPDQKPLTYQAKIDSIKVLAMATSRGFALAEMDRASLAGGRLVEVRLGLPYSMEEMLPDLAARYGTPGELTRDAVQNIYGASWKIWRASWMMPDGTIISAVETIGFETMLGYFRWTDLVFTSKDLAAQRILAGREKPSPLDR